MSKFNGHKNWNHWNVSLWINNDEGLYRHALECINTAKGYTAAGALRVYGIHKTGRDLAAHLMMQSLPSKTPDGAPYTVTTIRAAMREL